MSYELYALSDSRDRQRVRYIGYTKNPRWRLGCHLAEATSEKSKRSYKVSWIRKVIVEGATVIYRPLCVVENAEIAKQYEIQAIRNYKAAGHRLTNGTLGGDGIQGHKMPPDVIARLRAYRKTPEYLAWRSEQSRKHWSKKENRDKQRAAMKAVWASERGEEWRKTQAVANQVLRGQRRTPEAREKMRLAKLGKPHARTRTPEWNAKIAAAQAGKKRRPWTDEERDRHMAGMNNEKMSASAKARWIREHHENNS